MTGRARLARGLGTLAMLLAVSFALGPIGVGIGVAVATIWWLGGPSYAVAIGAGLGAIAAPDVWSLWTVAGLALGLTAVPVVELHLAYRDARPIAALVGATILLVSVGVRGASTWGVTVGSVLLLGSVAAAAYGLHRFERANLHLAEGTDGA